MARIGISIAIALAATLPSVLGASDGLSAEEIALLERADSFYRTLPPYMRPRPYTEIPSGLASLEASACGACHVAIYEEWRVSTHARAWEDDAQFQEELDKPEQNGSRGIDARWLCVNCHTPLVNQLPRLAVGLEDGHKGKPILVDNPVYDARLQLDAITCATCHVRDGVVLGPRGGGEAPHPVRIEPRLLREAVCLDCHQASAHVEDLGLTCAFETGDEFRESGLDDAGKTCQSCHMPAVVSPLVPGGPERERRRHWFGGSLIPKHPDFAAEIEALEAVFPDGLELRWLDLPPFVRAGDRLTLRLELHNAHAGHYLPTGDPERYIEVWARANDGQGKELSALERRIGSVWEWGPKPRRVKDTRLRAGEKRVVRLTLQVPDTNELRLYTRAAKWRLSEENFAYHELEGRYVRGKVFHERTRVIPVVARDEPALRPPPERPLPERALPNKPLPEKK